jgi:hypothetical protein
MMEGKDKTFAKMGGSQDIQQSCRPRFGRVERAKEGKFLEWTMALRDWAGSLLKILGITE